MRSSYFETDEKLYIAERLKVLLTIILTLFLILALNLAFIQIVRGRYYQKASRQNIIQMVREEAARGRILDRNGDPIVDNKAILNLFFIPHDLNISDIIPLLSSIISIPQDELELRFRKRGKSPFEGILIKEGLTLEEVIKLSEYNFKLHGLNIREEICRNYPHNKLASHIVGYVGHSGLELEYDQYLKGISGAKEIEVDARGNLYRVLREKYSKPGIDLILTIDNRLQEKAEELLKGKQGVIICINPENGEVMAMASSPGYSPAIFAERKNKEILALNKDTTSPLFNRAIQGRYPPGSIFKVITAGAFLEEGGSRYTTFQCNGSIEIGNTTFSCWKKDGHGEIDIVKAIAYSCDVYFYNLGLEIGIDRLSRYAKACGLGRKTGIDLPYEEKGFVPTRSWKKNFFRILSQKRWYPGETIVMSIGQGYLTVTPLQMAMLYSAIANGGYTYRPHLVRAMKRDTRESIFKPGLAGHLPFSRENLDIIKEGLYEAVEGQGTGIFAKIDNISVAGKTGTAQVIGSGKFEDSEVPFRYRDHAWFCGFAPYESPELVTVVLIEHGGNGAEVAAPIFKEIMEFYFGKIKGF